MISGLVWLKLIFFSLRFVCGRGDQTNSYNMMNIIQLSSKDEIKHYLATTIASISQEIIAEKDAFTIALSGGSLPEMLEGILSLFLSLLTPRQNYLHRIFNGING
jgi:hypothetical protein